MERLAKEGAKLEGTPLATTTTFEAVKSKEQMAQQTESSNSSGGGGLGGMLARKMMKKDNTSRQAACDNLHGDQRRAGGRDRASRPTDLAIPAGFKEKK